MADLKSYAAGFVLVVMASLMMPASARAGSDASVCPLVLNEERIDLKDTELDVELARSYFATFEEYFRVIAELKKNDDVDRMTYLKVRYDRDAAKVDLERANLALIRQEALIEYLGLACGEDSALKDADRSSEMDRTYGLYLHADCDQQAKAIEVAEINLEYNQLWLASVRDLRGEVSTRLDELLAELEVTREEQRRDDAMRRTEACRAALTEMEEARSSSD